MTKTLLNDFDKNIIWNRKILRTILDFINIFGEYYLMCSY